MLIYLTGGPAKGTAISSSEYTTQKLIQEYRRDGARVTLRRKYEWFRGERLEVDPKQHRISWSF